MFKQENIAVWKEELGNLCREKEAIKKEPNGSSRTENRLSKLTQEETENLNSFTVIKEIEFIIILPFTKKSLGPDDFTYKFYQTHKKKMPMLPSSFKRNGLANT